VEDFLADQDKLQFDQAERATAACSACHQPLTDSYFVANGQVVCANCRNAVLAEWNRSSASGRFGKALGLGLLAATACAVVWYLVLKWTDTQWGILAIVVGFVVGTAVRKGSNGRGGWRYQTLAMLLTYTAIVSSYVPFIIQGLREGSRETQQAAAPTDSVAATTTAASTSSSAAVPGPLAVVVALIALVLLFYATPILTGIQSPIGLLIVGIALYEAWKFNRKAELKIAGPYQVSGGAAPA
jgi:hypothetical protein